MTRDQFVDKLKEFEGTATHMYLDSIGVVTVGTGLALKTAAEAQKLSFTNRTTGKAATAAEIKADFDKVSAAAKGWSASSYKTYTALDAKPSSASTRSSTRGWRRPFRKRRPSTRILDLPSDIQSCPLVDMAYNLGGAGLNKFPTMKKHLEKGDFAPPPKSRTASGRAETRNTAIANWIKNAKAAPSMPTAVLPDAEQARHRAARIVRKRAKKRRRHK